MNETLVKAIMEVFVAVESAPNDQVDPDWATELLELLFHWLRGLKPRELRELKTIAKTIAAASQRKDRHSRRTQMLLSFCEELGDED